MLYKNRKKIQRKINKSIKEINLNIYNDNLWKARFTAKQVDAQYHPFSDGSGGVLHVLLQFEDRQTGKCVLHWLSTHGYMRFFNAELWMKMNDFIVMDCMVWEEDPRPSYQTSIDFRGLK